MAQYQNPWIQLIRDDASLSIDAFDLHLNLFNLTLDLFCKHIVFILDRFLLKTEQLNDTVALLCDNLFCKSESVHLLLVIGLLHDGRLTLPDLMQ